LHTSTPFGQLVVLPLHCEMLHDAPGSQRTMHVPEPGQLTVQSPWHATSQPPEPVHDTVLPGPTSTRQCPLPVQRARQSAPQMKSQSPEPAHWRSHEPPQSTAQSPVLGHTQLDPEHSTCPDVPVPRQLAGSASAITSANQPSSNRSHGKGHDRPHSRMVKQVRVCGSQ
jgi:hypothetical protein